MNIVPVVRFDLQFTMSELSSHIALLELGRSQLGTGEAYNKASKMIEDLEKVLSTYQNIRN
jgi:hypothetical protein